MILDENESSCMAALTRAGTSLAIRGSGMVRAGRVWGTARSLKFSEQRRIKDRAQLGLLSIQPQVSLSLTFGSRSELAHPSPAYPGTGNLAQARCPIICKPGLLTGP